VSYGRAVSQIEITMVCLQLKNTSAAPHGVTNIIMYVCIYIYIYAHINVSKAINPPYGLMVGIPAPKMGIADSLWTAPHNATTRCSASICPRRMGPKRDDVKLDAIES
jgi:hypothetical protein